MFITKSDLEEVLLYANNGLFLHALCILIRRNSEHKFDSRWDNRLSGMTASDRDGGCWYYGDFFEVAQDFIQEHEIQITEEELSEVFESFVELAPKYMPPELPEGKYDWILEEQLRIRAAVEKERIQELDKRGITNWR